MREYKGFDDRGTLELDTDEYEVDTREVGLLQSDIVGQKINGDP